MTDTLAWDETGSRYYETGVSRGTFFPIDGSTGVPWNGLISVALDPQGGEHEAYYFDGLKYMERTLAEDFQATVQAISTPKEFRPCEGVREYQPGVMTEMNKRDKFHMTWRTEISSDEGESVGYKLHISYNNLVQPAGRNYQTIADTTSMDIRSFVITATPACGKHSYFWFDSREYDLSLLEAQISAGVLPKCQVLATYVAPIGDAPPPDLDCPYVREDLESYVHGQVVASDDKVVEDTEVVVDGLINNGLDIVELPAVGAFAANDSAASEVGTGDILADDDDATYITSADGDLGYTVGLPPLVGYVDGCAFELHIRMSVSGGVDPDDPDNLDADAQVHISTDDTGETTIGGFSDGTDEGMGFAIEAVDGTIVDYVVPLDMDAWGDTTIDDVVTALGAGAYLDVVAVSNNNPDPIDTPIVVNVYEASVVMLNDTEPSKSLRFSSDHSDASIVMNIYDPSTTDNVVEQLTETIDFKIIQVPYNSAADGFTQDILDWRVIAGTSPGAIRLIPNGDGVPQLAWKADNGVTDLATYVDIPKNKWFTAQADWNVGSLRVRVFDREATLADAIFDHTEVTTMDPTALVKHWAGYVGSDGDSTVNHEVMIDNATMQIHCTSVAPPTDDWTVIDLSSMDPKMGNPSHIDMAAYTGGKIVGTPDWGDTSATFSIPGLTLDPTKTYDFEFTWNSPDTNEAYGIMQENPLWATTFFSDNRELFYSFPGGSGVFVATVGPGIDDWDTAVSDGYQTLIRFDVSNGLVSLRYKEH